MLSKPARLLTDEPRLFWGHVIRVLISRGWNPPPPDERIVDELLTEMERISAGPGPVPHVDLEDWEQVLTKREADIVRLVSVGLTNSAIASHLHVSERTVKFHLSNTYRKLGVSTRAELLSALVAR